MTGNDTSRVPAPNAEQRRIAAESFDRANQVISTGNHDYGIQLLMTCCKIDPSNLIYRQALRRAQKGKFKNNMRGSRFAALTSSTTKARLKAAKASGDYLKVLECGEEVLVRNPWDLGAQLDMAEAADSLGLLDMAVWLLEQARQKDGSDPHLNRTLARLYERRGNFAQAIALWELVKKADPSDNEAHHKAKDLAASETISRGQYEASASKPREDNETDAFAHDDHGTELAPVNDRVAREAAPLMAKLEQSPTDPMLYLQLAAVYTRAGRYDEARDVLRNGLGATGQHYQIQIELAEQELEPFRRNLALTEQKLEAIIDGKPASPDENEAELRRIRVRLLKEINSRELDLFRLKSDRFPNDLTHRIELGLRLLRAGKTEEAITELQQARKDPRHLWRALLYLGFAFKTMHNWRLAQRNFEEALQQVPPNEETHRKEILYQLATGHAEAGDLTKALDLGHELANIDYVYKDIGRLLEEWQQKKENA